MRKYKNKAVIYGQRDEFVKNPCEDDSPKKEESDEQIGRAHV